MTYSAEQKFLVPDAPGRLTACLKEILIFVRQQINNNTLSESLIFRTKIIVTELLNNAIKHAVDTETYIKVCINNEQICIVKSDFGAPFSINAILDFFSQPPGFKVQISKDGLHDLYMVIENQNKIKFICEDNILNDDIDYNNLLEHYGLLIMAKTADEFTYNYNPYSGLNSFNVLINL